MNRQEEIKRTLDRVVRRSHLKMKEIHRMLVPDLSPRSAVELAGEVARQLAALPPDDRHILRVKTALAIKDLETLLRMLEEHFAVVRGELHGIYRRRAVMSAYQRWNGKGSASPERGARPQVAHRLRRHNAK